ncbi:hypothetical protein HanPI659440_Chr00c11g0723191 [Helianthus annuus]|nr:hypothetical protein HanPI659440_Chr00c11g0723191 [Helianthus annuus]
MVKKLILIIQTNIIPGSIQASTKVEPQLLLKVFLLQSALPHHQILLQECFLRHLFQALQPSHDRARRTPHVSMCVLQNLRSNDCKVMGM